MRPRIAILDDEPRMVDILGMVLRREGRGLQAFLDAAAADRIRAVLAEAGGVRVEAARRLGIDRTTLYRLMRKYGLGDSD